MEEAPARGCDAAAVRVPWLGGPVCWVSVAEGTVTLRPGLAWCVERCGGDGAGAGCCECWGLARRRRWWGSSLTGTCGQRRVGEVGAVGAVGVERRWEEVGAAGVVVGR